MQIDAVVNDANAVGRDRIFVVHIALHRFRHGDHAIGGLVGDALDPARRRVRRAELLRFPWTMRFERVRGEHERDALQLLAKTAAEMRVPRVTVDDVHAGERAGHHEILQQRRKQLGMPRILRRQLDRRPDPLHLEVAVVLALIAETQHAHRVPAAVERGQFAGQVLHENARAAVHVWRVFIGEHSDIHGRSCCRRPSAGASNTVAQIVCRCGPGWRRSPAARG